MYKIIGEKKIRKKIEKISQKFSFAESKYVVNYFGAWGKREIVPKDFFGNNIVKRKFYKNDFRLPEKYDLYLKNIYGNYMELPPIDKRVSDHNVIEIKTLDCDLL